MRATIAQRSAVHSTWATIPTSPAVVTRFLLILGREIHLNGPVSAFPDTS